MKNIDFKVALQEWTYDRHQHNEPRLPIIVDPELKKRSPLPPLPQSTPGVKASGPVQVARPDASPLLPAIMGIGPPIDTSYVDDDLPSPCCAWPTPRSSITSSVASRRNGDTYEWDKEAQPAVPLLDKKRFARQSSGSALSSDTSHPWEDIADLYHWLPSSWTSSDMQASDSELARLRGGQSQDVSRL